MTALFGAALAAALLGGGASASAAASPRPAALGSNVVASTLVTPKSSVTPARVVPSALKIMNYYPSTAAWSRMWGAFHPASIDRDFSAIRAMGANAVRIVVQPSTFGYPHIWPVYHRRLKIIIGLAAKRGLSVQLTLFDWFSGYRDIPGSKTWARSLLHPLTNTRSVALVELQNEVNLNAYGAQAWIRSMLPYVKSILPGVPATISLTGNQTAATMRTLSTSAGTALDVIDVHLYGSPSNMAAALSAAKSIAHGRAVIVGEAGKSTYSVNASCANADQKRYYQAVIGIAAKFRVATIAPWTFTDFTDGAVPNAYRGLEQHFGLRALDGSYKPAASVIKSLFAYSSPAALTSGTNTAALSSIDIDSNFVCGVSPIYNDPTTAWSVFGSSLVGSVGVAASAGEGGGTAGYLSATGGSSSIWPSLMQEFSVTTANAVTAKANVRLVGATGTTVIGISWYKGLTYLGTSSSAVASNVKPGWQTLAVTAQPPAGATSFQVHLKSAWNNGTAYFDHVSIAS